MKIYRKLDAPDSTPKERLEALKASKDLMSGNGSGGIMKAIAGDTKQAPGHGAESIDGFIRLADYITTGHDYRDNHPNAKHMSSGVLIMPTISITVPEGVTAEDVARATEDHVSRETSEGDK